MTDPAALRDLFDRAVSLPPGERAAFLAHACASDTRLRQEVERLLAADAGARSLFDETPSPSVHGSDSAGPPRASALSPGTRLGPYAIDVMLGAGGMGEVYRARDTRLGRTIALKVLPADVSRDPVARQRLEREARAVAALSHPYICPLFDVGREGDIDYLVMEYLQGETLAARLRRGRLGLREALTVASQIAAGLAVAHRAGIVHRDLKPGNVMLTESGVRLLDFGLARQAASEPGDATALSAPEPLTGTGMILGTLPYMAPEQIEGRQAEARTDIFAFGVVFYEMVTGRRAFEAANQGALISQILRDDPPPLVGFDPSLPPELDRLIRRCIAKDPMDRWPALADVRTRLEALLQASSDARAGAMATVLSVILRRRLWIPAALVLLLGSGAIGWWSLHRPRDGAASSARTADAEPSVPRTLARLTFDQGLQTDPTFSPDGRFIAYASDKAGNFDIWVQPVAGGNAVQVTRAASHELQPDWSPDGTVLAFRSSREGGGIFAVPALGGVDRKIADSGYRPRFSPDGRKVLFVDSLAFESQRISPHAFVVPVSGGAPYRVGGSTWATLGWIQAIDWHPDGRVSVLSVPGGAARADRTAEAVEGQLTTMRLDGSGAVNSDIPREVRSQLSGCVRLEEFRWTRAGDRLLVVCQSPTTRNIWSITIDRATLAWVGPVRQLTLGGEFDYRLAVSRSSSLAAFTNQRSVTRLWAYQTDETGGRLRGPGKPVTPPDFDPRSYAITPDGRTLTYSGMALGSRQPQMWRQSLDSGRRSLLTDRGPLPAYLRHSDGSLTSYVRRDEDGRFRIVFTRSDDSAEHLVAESVGLILPFGWTPDESSIIGSAPVRQGERFSIVTWPVGPTAPGEPMMRRVLSDPRFDLWNGNYAPNGRWICLSANTGQIGGVSVIGIAAADGPPDRPWIQVTSETTWSDHPQWSSKGATLFYVAGYRELVPNVWAVSVDPELGRSSGAPHQVTTFDSPSHCLSPDRDMEIHVANGRLIAPVTETTGNIWLLDNVDR